MLTTKLKKLVKSNALRSLKQREQLIDFTSNDYLGLARDAHFQEAVIRRWREWSVELPKKVGSTGSRLLTGNHRFFEQTEEKIAAFHGFSSSTLFNCGYMANLSLISSFFDENDTLLLDVQVHASMHDGLALTKARTFYFRHNDLDHLEKRLKAARGRCFICIESIYSMSGDLAPLKEIDQLCDRYGAHLIVDEAHAVGVLGPQGKGLVAQENLQDKIFACMIAFGKAVGAHGAAILGSKLLKTTLLNQARPLIYTTALPLPLLAAIECSYAKFPGMQKQRTQLKNLSNNLGFSSHIHPFFVIGNSKARLASQSLAHRGFDVRPILSPTVRTGQERLRFTLHSYNSIEEAQQCVHQIKEWTKG